MSLEERVKALDGLKSEKVTFKIKQLEDQLLGLKADEKLEMKLNERLGREYKWLDKGSIAYQYYARTLYLAEKLKDDRTIANASLEILTNGKKNASIWL